MSTKPHKFTVQRYKRLGKVIRQHYNLDREVLPAEVEAEITSLHRKFEKGSLDDNALRLYTALDLAPTPPKEKTK